MERQPKVSDHWEAVSLVSRERASVFVAPLLGLPHLWGMVERNRVSWGEMGGQWLMILVYKGWIEARRTVSTEVKAVMPERLWGPNFSSRRAHWVKNEWSCILRLLLMPEKLEVTSPITIEGRWDLCIGLVPKFWLVLSSKSPIKRTTLNSRVVWAMRC